MNTVGFVHVIEKELTPENIIEEKAQLLARKPQDDWASWFEYIEQLYSAMLKPPDLENCICFDRERSIKEFELTLKHQTAICMRAKSLQDDNRRDDAEIERVKQKFRQVFDMRTLVFLLPSGKLCRIKFEVVDEEASPQEKIELPDFQVTGD